MNIDHLTKCPKCGGLVYTHHLITYDPKIDRKITECLACGFKVPDPKATADTCQACRDLVTKGQSGQVDVEGDLWPEFVAHWQAVHQ